MGLDIDFLANKMELLFNDIIVEEKILSLGNLKNELNTKNKIVGNFIKELRRIGKGKLSMKLLDDLESIETEFRDLYNNFDDRLMIFIIGNGNVGKSTLLNSLIGYEAAETNFLPNTWKIDIYSPSLKKSEGAIKYKNGNEKILKVEQVKKIIQEEEVKAKEGKRKYNIALKNELKKIKIKEERDEMKKYLAEEYLYKSNIIEAKWGVEKNWILDSCLLVDTPGLNQNLHQLDQLGNISDYYHKADGVLWLIDAQTIAAVNVKNIFDELSNTLEGVGGVRDNIIGVINRIDLVKETEGVKGVQSVIKNAQQNLTDKFHKIVPVSAMQAFNGIINNDKFLLEESGILDLQNSIRHIFISKANNIKNSAKLQGNNKLVNNIFQKLNLYQKSILNYEEMYRKKKEELEISKDNLQERLNNDLNDFYKSYLDDVRRRVDLYIDMLADGQKENFIKNRMYKLDEFVILNNDFLEKKMLEIENNIYIWEKICKISEYKYINNNDLLKKQNLFVGVDFELDALSTIEYFKPSIEKDIFSIIGNLFGKSLFWLRKNKIRTTINNAIESECNKIKIDIKLNINNKISKSAILYQNILNKSFADLLFDIKNIEAVESSVENFKMKLARTNEDIQLKEILF